MLLLLESNLDVFWLLVVMVNFLFILFLEDFDLLWIVLVSFFVIVCVFRYLVGVFCFFFGDCGIGVWDFDFEIGWMVGW